MIQDYLKYSYKNLEKRKLRTFLTLLGIIIAIATLFILISLSLGLRASINEQFRMLGTDKFFIMPLGQAGAPGSGGAVELTTKDVETIEKISGIKAVSYVTAGTGKIEFNNKARYYYVIGLPLDKIEVFNAIYESSNIKAEQGKLLEKNDKNVVMIGNDYIKEGIFGKPVKLGDKIKINDKEFKVKSILSRIGNPSDDKNLYIWLEDFKEMYNSGDRVDQILVQIKQNQDIKSIVSETERRLLKARGLTKKTKDFSILTPEELLSSFGNILNILTAFLVGIAAISLIVGGVGIANTMYTSVLERTKEIGTMKAIGAKNSDIMLIFLIESGLLGLIGGLMGVVFGMVVSKIIESIVAGMIGEGILKADFSFYLVLGSILFAFISGAISGIFPSRRASKIIVADALRYE